jgi:hypothetical protein
VNGKYEGKFLDETNTAFYLSLHYTEFLDGSRNDFESGELSLKHSWMLLRVAGLSLDPLADQQFVNLLRGQGNCIVVGACHPDSPVLRQFNVPTTDSLVDSEGQVVSSKSAHLEYIDAMATLEATTWAAMAPLHRMLGRRQQGEAIPTTRAALADVVRRIGGGHHLRSLGFAGTGAWSAAKVRKMPSWPRSWANFSLL